MYGASLVLALGALVRVEEESTGRDEYGAARKTGKDGIPKMDGEA